MLWRLVESFNDNLALLLLMAVGLAFAAGGLPPMMERRRRRSIEGALPGFLEALSDGVGAGLGLQEVMSDQSDNQPGAFGALLRESLSKSHVTSFDAALASFATSTRSSQVQRVIQLIQTAVEQNSPLQSVLYDLANDYQRLNDLIDKREKDLSGLVMTIVLFICIGLPGLLRSSLAFCATECRLPNRQHHLRVLCLLRRRERRCRGHLWSDAWRMRAMMWWIPFWTMTSMTLFSGPC